MRVLFWTMQFGRGYSQGTERYLTLLRGGLTAAGVETQVWAADPEHRAAKTELGDAIDNDSSLRAVPSHGWPTIVGEVESRLAPQIAEFAPDVVHILNPGFVGVGVLAAARRLGIATVASVVDYWWLCPKHTLQHYRGGICDANVSWRECLACIAAERPRSFRRVVAHLPILRDIALPPAYALRWLASGVPMREVLRWPQRQQLLLSELDACDAVIFLSQAARERIGEKLMRAAKRVIRNGLAPEWFREPLAQPDSLASRPPESLTLGFAGALAPHKGPQVLLQALRQLGWTRTRLRLAGTAENAEFLARLHELARGLNVEFAEKVATPDMPAFYRSLDALVVPSTWLENLPMVVLEARASGTPVLASDVPGIAEFVPAARRFAVGDAAALATCLERWRRGEAKIEGPATPRVDEMISATLDVYRDVLALRGDASITNR